MKYKVNRRLLMVSMFLVAFVVGYWAWVYFVSAALWKVGIALTAVVLFILDYLIDGAFTRIHEPTKGEIN